MNEHSGEKASVWMATAAVPEFPPLAENVTTDVCIVGAGISGLTTAYLLAREGRKVVVVDDGPIVSGETERTTAHLSFALDDRYFELERVHGEEGARLAAESHRAAVDMIERIVREEGIDCDFTRLDGYLFNPPGEKSDVLHRELAAAQRAGLKDIEIVERAPLISYNTGPALLFPNQGQFHPVKYLVALAQAIIRMGGRIFAGTHAEQFVGGAGAFVGTSHGWKVNCGAIVVATNTPVNDRVAIHTKQRPYRTYAVGLAVPVGTVPKVLYWDTEDPYHYVRLEAAQPGASGGRDILIVGGEDHETGQADDTEARFDRLEDWARKRYPMVAEVRYRWSGQVMEPVDMIAYIGRNPMDAENVYIVTGDSGHGMTHGTIAGILLTDLIQGRPNAWEKLYSPSRQRPQAAGEYLSDNLNMAAQYTDWFTRGEAKSEDEIAPGCGAVVRRGLTKVAIYRDETGDFHECSAVCPHLGGIVNWNDTEKTWDCPVHGSRFDRYGHVVNGPSNSDLKAKAEVQK